MGKGPGQFTVEYFSKSDKYAILGIKDHSGRVLGLTFPTNDPKLNLSLLEQAAMKGREVITDPSRKDWSLEKYSGVAWYVEVKDLETDRSKTLKKFYEGKRDN